MRKAVIFLVIPFVLLLLVMLILPVFTVPDYSILRNTTSHLGAQFAPHAWIMNLTFVLLGLGSLIAGWTHLKGYVFHRIILAVFALALCCTAVFRHAPITAGLSFDTYEDQLHSLFASVTGFSFTVFAISTAFVLRLERHKAFAVVIALLATILSILMFASPDWMGIWQRLIFIFSFGWLIWLFSRSNHLT